jgi:hypothetical protein
MRSLSQSQIDMKSRSRIMTNMKSRSVRGRRVFMLRGDMMVEGRNEDIDGAEECF